MYTSAPPISITSEHSVSLLPGNLSAAGSYAGFANQASGVVVDLTRLNPDDGGVAAVVEINHSSPHKVYQVALLELGGGLTAVLLSTTGAEFWRVENGRTMLLCVKTLESFQVLPWYSRAFRCRCRCYYCSS
jgi:hypothetical protein